VPTDRPSENTSLRFVASQAVRLKKGGCMREKGASHHGQMGGIDRKGR